VSKQRRPLTTAPRPRRSPVVGVPHSAPTVLVLGTARIRLETPLEAQSVVSPSLGHLHSWMRAIVAGNWAWVPGLGTETVATRSPLGSDTGSVPQPLNSANRGDGTDVDAHRGAERNDQTVMGVAPLPATVAR
jgi:hypothetical protein